MKRCAAERRQELGHDVGLVAHAGGRSVEARSDGDYGCVELGVVSRGDDEEEAVGLSRARAVEDQIAEAPGDDRVAPALELCRLMRAMGNDDARTGGDRRVDSAL